MRGDGESMSWVFKDDGSIHRDNYGPAVAFVESDGKTVRSDR